MDELLRFRSEFPQLEERTYLVSHSLGAMPRAAAAAAQAYTDEWRAHGVEAWAKGWWDLPLTVGDRLAPLLGASPGSVGMQPNVTLATAIFLSALDWSEGRDGLVTTSLEFPSVLYVLRGEAARGARITEVPSEGGLSIDTERLLAAIDERTRVVVLSHVLFRSSSVMDVAAIAARAREVGALTLLDTYQSVGTLPVDLPALGVDAAVGGCLKWLCGGPGSAFLWIRPDLVDTLQPRLTGWQAHTDPFAFDAGEMTRPDGIGRFLHGTPAIPALRAAEVGLDLVKAAGPEAIRAKSVSLTARMIERADREGWTVNTPRDPERRGGTVTLDPPHAWEVSRGLLAAGIVIDFRPGSGIRIAPHFYNRADELDVAMDAIASLLSSGEWERHAGRTPGQVN